MLLPCVKCLMIPPGNGLTWSVSTGTISPGASAAYSRGSLTAYGRLRYRFRAERPLPGGSCGIPRSCSRRSIRPTVAVDVLYESLCSSTMSLSLPQRGCCSLRARTAAISSGEYSSCRTRLGRCERSCSVSRCCTEYRFFQR